MSLGAKENNSQTNSLLSVKQTEMLVTPVSNRNLIRQTNGEIKSLQYIFKTKNIYIYIFPKSRNQTWTFRTADIYFFLIT